MLDSHARLYAQFAMPHSHLATIFMRGESTKANDKLIFKANHISMLTWKFPAPLNNGWNI